MICLYNLKNKFKVYFVWFFFGLSILIWEISPSLFKKQRKNVEGGIGNKEKKGKKEVEGRG